MNLSDVRFLLVDDFKTIRTMTWQILQNLGFKNVKECSDGQEAMEYLKEIRKKIPLIIISDLHMPNMDGLEFKNKLRRNEYHKDAPFILLTGEEDNFVHSVGEQVGIKYVVQKPASQNDLAAVLRKALMELT